MLNHVIIIWHSQKPLGRPAPKLNKLTARDWSLLSGWPAERLLTMSGSVQMWVKLYASAICIEMWHRFLQKWVKVCSTAICIEMWHWSVPKWVRVYTTTKCIKMWHWSVQKYIWHHFLKTSPTLCLLVLLLPQSQLLPPGPQKFPCFKPSSTIVAKKSNFDTTSSKLPWLYVF